MPKAREGGVHPAHCITTLVHLAWLRDGPKAGKVLQCVLRFEEAEPDRKRQLLPCILKEQEQAYLVCTLGFNHFKQSQEWLGVRWSRLEVGKQCSGYTFTPPAATTCLNNRQSRSSTSLQ